MPLVRLLARKQSVPLQKKPITSSFYRLLNSPPGEPSLPQADIVTCDWALFRWLKSSCCLLSTFTAAISGKLPEPLSTKVYERLEHDVLDAQYLILGLLEGAFANKGKEIAEMVAPPKPDGSTA